MKHLIGDIIGAVSIFATLYILLLAAGASL
jgi:hypothetical protein